MKGKSKPNPIIKLCIRTYKIPVTIEDGKVILSTVNFTEDMVINTENIELNRMKDNVSLKIPEYGRKVAKHNENQENFTLKLGRDYITKQILTKQ